VITDYSIIQPTEVHKSSISIHTHTELVSENTVIPGLLYVSQIPQLIKFPNTFHDANPLYLFQMPRPRLHTVSEATDVLTKPTQFGDTLKSLYLNMK